MATSPTNNIVYVQRLLPATPQEVFDAWINPDSLAAWMRPDEIARTSAELDVRVGGSYRIVMRSATAEYTYTGEYLEIHPYERLVFTWRVSADWPQASIVTVELHPQQDGTQLELTPTAARRRVCSQLSGRLAEHYREIRGAPACPSGTIEQHRDRRFSLAAVDSGRLTKEAFYV